MIDAGPGVFGILRSADEGHAVLCLHNVKNEASRTKLNDQAIHGSRAFEHGCIDLISGGGVVVGGMTP